MTASGNFQVPIENLYEIESNLELVSEDLGAIEQGVMGLVGVDDLTGHKLASAVESFFDEWKQSRKTLLENIGILGEVSGEIAVQTGTFDSDVSSGLDEFTDKIQTREGS